MPGGMNIRDFFIDDISSQAIEVVYDGGDGLFIARYEPG